ncbi:Hypothetical predicted protein [Mytilus galloprovincialis]|nr:Hypothetical predicted protein [Mytilus galloprovincialis]
MNNPCMLFNPFFEICCLEMKHEGLYTYKRGNDSKNGCMLTMEICKDIIISSKPCVYWAHEGEWIKLQLVQTSVVVEHWIKKNTENKKEIIIPNPQKKSSLVLQNINNKDAGSYIAANTSETWKSGCLTLKIVNSLVTVGKKDDSYVTMIKNSIKLKFIGCKLANIKLLKWKKSLLTEGTEIRELESTSNYELILSKMTKNDEGRYWCEVTNIDDTSTNSGILTLHVVHDIVNVGLSPASCSATIGDSIQIRYFNEIIPQQIIFTAKRSGFNQIAPERKVTKITDTASLFIEEISKEDEGCYLFASADGDAISGVLTLSVIEGNERYNNLYLGQSESGRSAFQPRNGANTFLDAIPKKEDIQETPDKKKKKKGKKTKKEKEKAEEVDETA